MPQDTQDQFSTTYLLREIAHANEPSFLLIKTELHEKEDNLHCLDFFHKKMSQYYEIRKGYSKKFFDNKKEIKLLRKELNEQAPEISTGKAMIGLMKFRQVHYVAYQTNIKYEAYLKKNFWDYLSSVATKQEEKEKIEKLKADYFKHARFAAFNSQLLDEFYKDLLNAKEALDDINQFFEEREKKLSPEEKDKDVNQTFRKNIKQYISELNTLEDEVIESMAARFRASVKYEDLECDDVMLSVLDDAHTLMPEKIKKIERMNLEEGESYLEHHTDVSKGLYIQHRGLSNELASQFYRYINLYCRENPQKKDLWDEISNFTRFKKPLEFEQDDFISGSREEAIITNSELWYSINYLSKRCDPALNFYFSFDDINEK